MANYIDGFVLPIPKEHLNEYKAVAKAVAQIILEYGALGYQEFVGDDMNWDGTVSFPSSVNSSDEETVIFGWISFESRDERDRINKLVAADPRMEKLVTPITEPDNMIFDAKRMIYGGFESWINMN